LLPAGTDCYLTGGRADDAELRLTNYLLQNLKKGDVFFDIGAHFGFYSCLAIQSGATVHAFEPSPLSFEILKANSAGRAGMQVHPFIVGDTDAEKPFFSFEPKYSEYDTTAPAQYEEQSWYRKAIKQLNHFRCTTLDRFVREFTASPDLIKIDTEGSEAAVISGATELLNENNPVIILEYLAEKRGNASHRKALELLAALGYNANTIREDGTLEKCDDPEKYLEKAGRDSENLVLKKQ
jgi:FkbM family methyltransferase